MVVINSENGNHTEASILQSRAMLKVSNCFYTVTFVQKPFYVRCIKPNDIKSSTTFDDKRVGHQVRGNVIGKWFVGSKQWHVTGEIFQPFFFLFFWVFCFPALFAVSDTLCLSSRAFFYHVALFCIFSRTFQILTNLKVIFHWLMTWVKKTSGVCVFAILSSLNHSISSSDGRCVQRAGT